MKKKIFYVSELNLPNTSAYSIHVMKMCDAFNSLNYNLSLICLNNNSKKNTFKYYNIKKKFNIISIFKISKKMNFFFRVFFSLLILKKIKDQNSIFISRSIIFALIASTLNKNIILELHHEITGFSKYIYRFLNSFFLLKNLKYIFLHKNLEKIYKIENKKKLILDDASDYKNFYFGEKKFKNTCIYVGSFFEGKGIEQIYRLAKDNPKINFHAYGEKKYLFKKKTTKNLKIYNHVQYSKIPLILSRYHVALMPYQKKIKGKSSIYLENYMSPLKMFDYLSAGLITIASNLKVYRHILINNHNCKLVKVNDDKIWSKTINNIFKNLRKYNYIKNNSLKTAKKYSWDKRAKKIASNFF